jgi:hypothetical protein
VRSDSRTIAIATAPASTASPASCPPMRRESSGTVAAASAMRTVLWVFAGVLPTWVGAGVVGATVGNSPVGSVLDEVPLPDSGGRLTGGSVVSPLGDEVGDVLAVELAMTTSVAELLKERAEVPLAVAVSSTCSPMAALLPTFTVASSSSTCCSGTLPMLHVAPEEFGHTLKLGEPRPVAETTCNLTATPLPAAFVLQTQITKFARCPALTWDELEKD